MATNTPAFGPMTIDRYRILQLSKRKWLLLMPSSIYCANAPREMLVHSEHTSMTAAIETGKALAKQFDANRLGIKDTNQGGQ